MKNLEDRSHIYGRSDFHTLLAAWGSQERRKIDKVHDENTRLINIAALLSMVGIIVFAALSLLVHESFIWGIPLSLAPSLLGYPLFKKDYERMTFEEYVVEHDQKPNGEDNLLNALLDERTWV